MTDKAGYIAKLIKRHNQGELTEDDRNALAHWFNESEENRRVFNELTNEDAIRQALRDLYEFKHKQNGNKSDRM